MALLVPEITDGRIDGFAVPHAALDALDMQKVEEHIERAIEAGRLDNAPRKPRDFLSRYRCIIEHHGAPVATMAGILMFAYQPQFFFPHADVGLGHFPSSIPDTEDVIHLKRHGGTLPEQIDVVEGYLWSNTRRGFTVEDSARRVEKPEYPRKVIRELTVNAIAHRDYNSTGKHTRISMFTDRIEWVSPGGLPGGITIENILQEQFARNPTIAELLHQAGYIERFGIGLDTVMRELRRAGLPDLGMRDTGVSFTVTVYGQDAPSIRAQTPFRLKLLEYARQHGQITMDDARRLNEDLQAFRSDRSLLNDLKGLVEAGFLQRVGRSRDTAYLPTALDL
ncbi:MAG TPA: ATP-binding protein [Herpetosiphonaceae bacterium]